MEEDVERKGKIEDVEVRRSDKVLELLGFMVEIEDAKEERSSNGLEGKKTVEILELEEGVEGKGKLEVVEV